MSVFAILLKTNIIVTISAGPKTNKKTRSLLINNTSWFNDPYNLKNTENKTEIGQIKKNLKFPLSNKIFKVSNYVLSYIKRDFFNGIK